MSQHAKYLGLLGSIKAAIEAAKREREQRQTAVAVGEVCYNGRMELAKLI